MKKIHFIMISLVILLNACQKSDYLPIDDQHPKGNLSERLWMIKKVSSFIPYSDWVSSKGLGWYKDEKDPHFNTEAQLLLGKRYAKKILKFYKHQ